jgi:hypothetical protein
MRSIVKGRRLSPALVISLIALFVSIGGIGYAASKIGTNDIKNGAVTTKKLHNAAVSTKKIKGNAVTGAKAKESSFGQVPDAAHANNADNATSANSANTANGVAAGSVGAAGLKNTYTSVSAGIPAAANTFVNGQADCSAGDKVLGGGYAWLNVANTTNFSTAYSTPDPFGDNPVRWIAQAKSSVANTLFVWAVCLRQ